MSKKDTGPVIHVDVNEFLPRTAEMTCEELGRYITGICQEAIAGELPEDYVEEGGR